MVLAGYSFHDICGEERNAQSLNPGAPYAYTIPLRHQPQHFEPLAPSTSLYPNIFLTCWPHATFNSHAPRSSPPQPPPSVPPLIVLLLSPTTTLQLELEGPLGTGLGDGIIHILMSITLA